ncbi:MAG TPA: PfkB family carbohydrate kinase [Terriglobales bacterium]|nr:PfkB family carbohydrate kinase [Terriglobales bacterium]
MIPRDFDVIGYGLSSVDHLCVVRNHPRLDSKQEMVAYEVQPGGQVPTALVALQRWGLQTAYVAAFGSDDAGCMAREALIADGVDVSATLVRQGVRQQASIILIDQVSGERSVLSQPADELIVGAGELQPEVITAGRVLLMDAVDMEGAILAARWAKRAAMLTVLDIDNPASGIAELLALTDVLVVGSDFPARLTGTTDVRRALRQAAAMGPWFVGVTLGPGGVLALVDDQFHFVPAFPTRVVDSTGAGDLFHAGCVYGLLQQWPAAQTLRFAAAAAALKCEKLGARPGIPSLEQTEALAQSATLG